MKRNNFVYIYETWRVYSQTVWNFLAFKPEQNQRIYKGVHLFFFASLKNACHGKGEPPLENLIHQKRSSVYIIFRQKSLKNRVLAKNIQKVQHIMEISGQT